MILILVFSVLFTRRAKTTSFHSNHLIMPYSQRKNSWKIPHQVKEFPSPSQRPWLYFTLLTSSCFIAAHGKGKLILSTCTESQYIVKNRAFKHTIKNCCPYTNDCWRVQSINKLVFVCICSKLDNKGLRWSQDPEDMQWGNTYQPRLIFFLFLIHYFLMLSYSFFSFLYSWPHLLETIEIPNVFLKNIWYFRVLSSGAATRGVT